MRELGEALNSAASRVKRSPGAFDTVLARAERRRRVRRFGAAIVGMALSAGTVALLVFSFGPGGERAPLGVSPSDRLTVEAPTGTITPSPTGPSPTADPSNPGPRILAITTSGDLVTIQVEAGLAEGPPASDPEVNGVLAASVDIEVAPTGEILVVTCCEPAAGAIYILNERYEHVGLQHGLGIDVLEDTREVAIAGIDGIDVFSSIEFRDFRSIPLNGRSESPEWPTWDPRGRRLVYVAGGNLYSVSSGARTLDEAETIGTENGSWYSPVVTEDGVVAIRSQAPWASIGAVPEGPSSVVLIDPSGERPLYESQQSISSLAVADDGTPTVSSLHAGSQAARDRDDPLGACVRESAPGLLGAPASQPRTRATRSFSGSRLWSAASQTSLSPTVICCPPSWRPPRRSGSSPSNSSKTFGRPWCETASTRCSRATSKNYLASAASLRDHVRHLMDGRDGQVTEEFDRRKKEVLQHPEIPFVFDLPNFALHRKLAFFAHTLSMSNVKKPIKVESEVQLNVVERLEWNGWTSAAQAYLRGLGEGEAASCPGARSRLAGSRRPGPARSSRASDAHPALLARANG